MRSLRASREAAASPSHRSSGSWRCSIPANLSPGCRGRRVPAETAARAPRGLTNVALAIAAVVAVAGALAAAWFQPPLAVAVVWPILFVVPGWAIVGWVRPRIPATGRLGLAIVLSVALSTHLVYWLSLAAGG